MAWHNGHPDYCERQFDLSVERAAVVGVGNVAIDVARMLVRTPEELEATDVADYALDALRKSRVREVFLLGRRGPAQAAFTNPEIKEIGEMADADVIVRPDEVALDPLSQAELDASHDRELVESRDPPGPCGQKARGRPMRSLVSPVEPVGDAEVAASHGCASCATRSSRRQGAIAAKAPASSRISVWGPCFGRWALAAPSDVPFHERWGVIPNEKGRVMIPHVAASSRLHAGLDQRGPSGVIGTNKPDAVETYGMIEDSPVAPSASRRSRKGRRRRLVRAAARCSIRDWRAPTRWNWRTARAAPSARKAHDGEDAGRARQSGLAPTCTAARRALQHRTAAQHCVSRRQRAGPQLAWTWSSSSFRSM